MNDFRLALAAGTVYLPRMHFVVAQGLAMESVESRLFACSVSESDLAGMPVTQNLHRMPMPDGLRRRTYPLTGVSLQRRLVSWHPDAINLHFLALGGYAARSAEQLGVPMVSTIHAVEPFLMRPATSRRQRYLRDDARRAMEGSNLLVAVSDYIAEWLRSLGVEEGRIRTQYLGIDTDYWSSETPPLTRLEARRVVFVGHLTDLKGASLLVEASLKALGAHPHQLDLAGDGPLRPRLSDVAAQNPHITIHGSLPRHRVRELLNGASLLVLPTMPTDGVEDAAPTVLAEAQSMGVPVLAFATGGTPEMVESPECLVTNRTVDDLAEGLIRVLGLSEMEYSECSRRARAWVVRERNIKSCAAEVLALTQSLAAN